MANLWEAYIKVHGDGVTHHHERPNIHVTAAVTDATYREGSVVHGYVTAYLHALDSSASYFGYPLGMAVSIDDSTPEVIFTKPAYPSQWSTGEFSGSVWCNVVSTKDTATFRIWFYAVCKCPGDDTPHVTIDGCTYYQVATYDFPGGVIPPADVELTYNANGGTNAPQPQTIQVDTPTPISKSEPTKKVTLRCQGNGAVFNPSSTTYYDKSVSIEFKGWSKTKARADAGTVDYAPGASITISEDTTIYASWGSGAVGALPVVGTTANQMKARTGYRLDTSTPWTTTQNGNTPITSTTRITVDTTAWAKWEYLITLNFQGGYAVVGDNPETDIWAGPLSTWKKYGARYSNSYRWVKRGYVMQGFNTSSSATTASYPAAVNYSGNTPITLYAIWKANTYTVRFHDGYSPAGSDILSTSQVVYGNSVPASQVPKVGQVYHGKVFRKPGTYTFRGWSGNYQNVDSNTEVYAVWEFVPLWINVRIGANLVWVPYWPVEE